MVDTVVIVEAALGCACILSGAIGYLTGRRVELAECMSLLKRGAEISKSSSESLERAREAIEAVRSENEYLRACVASGDRAARGRH